MRIVVSYDISDDKRRRKVAQMMEGVGFRVQYSVFECDLNKRQLATLQKRLRPLIKKEMNESVRFYPLPEDAVAQIQILGADLSRQLGVVTIV